MAKHKLPDVNAGSMADIAFLLLIFFLVTTTIEQDNGIFRKIPEDNQQHTAPIHKRNILDISINEANKVLVEDNIESLDDLTQLIIDFIDNGGIINKQDQWYCNYCSGNHNAASSDHPKKAMVSIQTHRKSKYKTYVAVQDKIASAYAQLRNELSAKNYGFEFTTVKQALNKGSYEGNIEKATNAVREIQEMYPLHIAEVQIQKYD